MPKKPARREWGSGSITWLTPTKARLQVRSGGTRHSKNVRVSHRDQGGRGEAKAMLAAFEAEVAAGPALPSGPTAWDLRQLMEAYVADRARVGKKQSTLESYDNTTKRLTEKIAATPIDQLTPDDFDRLYGALALRGLNANTIRQSHAVLTAAMGWAVQKGKVPVNVAARATPPDRKRTAKTRIDPADAQTMIQAAVLPKERGGEGDVVLAIAIFLATYAGLRRGELCGLQWTDFDANDGLLRCERQWVPGRGGQHLEDLKSDTGSLDGVRLIEFAPKAVGLVERYREHLTSELEQEPNGWLLSYDGGSTPLRAKALTERIARLGRKLGIEVSTHSFRRTADTQLVAAGVDVDTAARRSGHTTEVMLRHYVLGASDKAVAAAAALETRLIDQGLGIGELLA